MSDTTETLEGTLEHARQSGATIQLVLGGHVESPVAAVVRGRNGSTFEFLVGNAVIRMDVSNVVIRVA